jgi:hypothetical protein
MNPIPALAILAAASIYVGVVHSYYRRQRRICATYPYYRLRDRVIWEMLQDPEHASDKERLYKALNRIVHHAGKFGWKFISDAVMEATHTVLHSISNEMLSNFTPSPDH